MAGGVLIAIALACGAPQTLPPELQQTWHNSRPEYRDRYLELREDWLIFGTGRFSHTMHPIASVESQPTGDRTEYRIEYRHDDGSLLSLRLLHSPGPPAQLTIGSRPDVWVPRSAADWLEEES